RVPAQDPGQGGGHPPPQQRVLRVRPQPRQVLPGRGPQPLVRLPPRLQHLGPGGPPGLDAGGGRGGGPTGHPLRPRLLPDPGRGLRPGGHGGGGGRLGTVQDRRGVRAGGRQQRLAYRRQLRGQVRGPIIGHGSTTTSRSGGSSPSAAAAAGVSTTSATSSGNCRQAARTASGCSAGSTWTPARPRPATSTSSPIAATVPGFGAASISRPPDQNDRHDQA